MPPIFGCRALRRTSPANSPLERMTRSGVGIGVGAAFDLVSGTTRKLPDGFSVRVWNGRFGWRLSREGCLGDISLSSPVFLCYMAETFINNRWH